MVQKELFWILKKQTIQQLSFIKLMTNKKIYSQYQKKIKDLKKYNKFYFEKSKPLISDKDYDKLKKEVIDRITGTDFFATLPKFQSADALIDMVKKFTGGKFSINTSPLRGDNENSGKYKKIWISNNIDKPNEIVVTGRKETYAKDKASGTPNILIDDRPVNIQRWQDAGGYGILYQANRDSLDKVKKGLEDYAKVQRDQ